MKNFTQKIYYRTYIFTLLKQALFLWQEGLEDILVVNRGCILQGEWRAVIALLWGFP